MSVFHNNILAGAAGSGGAVTPTAYQVDRSLRFNRADDAHLSRTISTKYTTFTTSCWVKRASFNTWQYIWAQYDGSAYRGITFGQNSDKLSLYDGNHVYTTAVFRDPAAWYHIVLKCSSGAATLYVNNTQVSTTTNFFIGGGSFRIGDFITGSNEFDGYIADFHAVLGTAHDPTDFAEYDDNNNWNPKEFSGNFGSDGFHLDFSDNSSNAALGTDSSGNSNTFTVNNLVASTHADGAAGFDVVTYTGTASTQQISGLKFQPDLVWLRRRDSAGNHNIQDVVRGASAFLQSDYNGQESTSGSRLSSFDSNGFTLTSDNGSNASGGSYVGWCWKAGGAASANSDGSINSQTSVSTDYGFSIVTYTGNGSTGTVGHDLSSTPEWIVVKNRSAAASWYVYHVGLSSGKALNLNNTEAEFTPSQAGITAVSDSTFSLGSERGETNANNQNYVAYCWSEVSGFSKFGSYSGSSSDVTVTTGFKPGYILIKCTDTAGQEWIIKDSERGGDKYLHANDSSPEATGRNVTFNSDGFTLAHTQGPTNFTGRNYIYMAFADTPDFSGNDSLIDTPTNADADSGNNIGNYCTLNPLAKGAATSLSNGNLNYVGGAANQTLGTIGMSSGKWYWEDHKISGTYGATGIALADAPLNNHPGQGNSWAYNKNGSKWHNGSSSSYGATWDSGDTIGIAFDADAGTLVFYKNGVSQGTAFTGLTNGPYFVTGADNSVTGYFNFGASGSFAYTPPTGYKSLCTQNLTDPTIANGADAFYALAYDGTFGGGTVTDSNANFTPDWVWVKRRNTAERHKLYDVVRGTDGTRYKHLESDGSDAEGSNETGITAFVAGGFTSEGGGHINSDGQPFIAWMWDASTSFSNSAGSNNATIASSGKVNNTAGFSIVSYSGSGSSGTVGHGLNAAPELILLKERNGAENWRVHHAGVNDFSKTLFLNLTNGATTNTERISGTSSSTFTLSSGGASVNSSGKTYIAYCFAPVEGYSAFGSYTGNGSSDGPFVYTGFKPAFILIKGSSFTSNWFIQDNERDGYNVNDGVALRPNLANAEDGTTTYNLDILSNGFKLRTSAADANTNNATFVWAAFASHPFKTSRAR